MKLEPFLTKSIDCIKDGQKASLRIEGGITEFTLAHGEIICFPEIPEGCHYQVTELDGKTDGYRVKEDNTSGTIKNRDITVSFINEKRGTVPTDSTLNTSLYIPLLFFALMVTTGLTGRIWKSGR